MFKKKYPHAMRLTCIKDKELMYLNVCVSQLGLLLVVSLVQASIWPYHGSAPVTGAIINEYGPVAYGHASLAANPIVVPDITRGYFN